MNILLRVDSGEKIGGGHQYRCLNLARALQKDCKGITFLAKNYSGNMNDVIESEFEVREMKHDATLDEDINLTNKMIIEKNVDVVIVDSYALGIEWEKSIRIKNLVVIEDMMNRSHKCNLLIDQNITAEKDKYIKLNTESGAKYLLGTQYAILHERIRLLREENCEKNKITIFFGVNDPTRETLKLLKSMPEHITEDIKIYVNFNLPDIEEIKLLSNNRKNVIICELSDKYHKDLSESFLFIGAGGSSSWERACLGIPSLVVTVADNQVPITIKLSEMGYIKYLFDGRDSSIFSWEKFWKENKDLRKFKQMGQRSSHLVDGLGAMKVAREISGMVSHNDKD